MPLPIAISPMREHHRRLASGAVAVGADQGAAKRPGDEADAEGGR